MTQTALITGASSGIGAAFAQELAGRGFDLILTARRAQLLEDLKHTLTGRHAVRVELLPADLSVAGAATALWHAVKERTARVDMLVNNAGYALSEPYHATSWSAQAALLNVMVTAVAELTHLVLPEMLERRSGHVLHVASIYGLLYGVPGTTLYAPAKAFCIKFAEALEAELHGSGVTVTAVCPGFTRTAFHAANHLQGQVAGIPDAAWMDPGTVARQAIEAALAGKVRVVNGRINRLMTSVLGRMPHRLARALTLQQASRMQPRHGSDRSPSAAPL